MSAINEKSINWPTTDLATILYKRNTFARIYETTFMLPHLVFPRVNSIINIRRCLYNDNRLPYARMCLSDMLHMCRRMCTGIFRCQWTWMVNWNYTLQTYIDIKCINKQYKFLFFRKCCIKRYFIFLFLSLRYCSEFFKKNKIESDKNIFKKNIIQGYIDKNLNKKKSRKMISINLSIVEIPNRILFCKNYLEAEKDVWSKVLRISSRK